MKTETYIVHITGYGTNEWTFILNVGCSDIPDTSLEPSNDSLNDCSMPVELSCEDTVEDSTVNCPNIPSRYCGTSPGLGPVKVFFISGVAARVRLLTCGSSFDTQIQVFQERITKERVLTCVGGDDDSCGKQSEFTFEVVETESYIVLITGYGTYEGSFQLSVWCSPIPGTDTPLI